MIDLFSNSQKQMVDITLHVNNLWGRGRGRGRVKNTSHREFFKSLIVTLIDIK